MATLGRTSTRETPVYVACQGCVSANFNRGCPSACTVVLGKARGAESHKDRAYSSWELAQEFICIKATKSLKRSVRVAPLCSRWRRRRADARGHAKRYASEHAVTLSVRKKLALVSLGWEGRSALGPWLACYGGRVKAAGGLPAKFGTTRL
ncbi:hypothetical protein CRG98_030070 [Punica granatum]|uniref:Uncharacterized protein n=1 Tax=Punica granatum TaxID=22663 RepID=A0A2I0J0I9_PUNGR|nr:hypothetical protein CRG98_030070 [Punica granatum]